MKERLQKIIAAAGLASRREAEGWITQGRVKVNGSTAQLGDSADPIFDKVEVDNRILGSAPRRYYVLLHKPTGYVTTRHDPEGRSCVVDLVSDVPARLNPVGRLDLTTEGVLLLTNDGELANRLIHPRHGVEKTYLVRIRGELDSAAVRLLESGVELSDGVTAPAKVGAVRSSGSHTWFEITLHEGRNRQVRRMCEAIGRPVSRLKRIRFAFLELGSLKPGEYRYLLSDEVERLRRLTALTSRAG